MRALIYIILIIIVAGCNYVSSQYERELNDAESLLKIDPLKAFEQLNKYDVTEFSDSATMARWALLYCEAMVVNHFAAPTDTIINIAVDYYGFHDNREKYNKACEVKSSLGAGSIENALVSAMYIQKEKEFLLFKEKALRNEVILLSIIIIMVAGGVIVWQRQHLKLKNARNETLIMEASALKESLCHRQVQCAILESKLSASLENRFKIIDELCETYYESQGSKTEKKAIVDKVKSQIDALKADEGIFTEMEHCNDEMLSQLKNDFPALKPDEYRLMVYLASGLSNRTIALLIGESIDTAYKRKSRLKAKITASESINKEIFLNVF
ncbi:MAG: hypothetical protein HDR88_03215 [Bacteroides sp.]|nr:hypothetical protein [Bacteroides sp.]